MCIYTFICIYSSSHSARPVCRFEHPEKMPWDKAEMIAKMHALTEQWQHVRAPRRTLQYDHP